MIRFVARLNLVLLASLLAVACANTDDPTPSFPTPGGDDAYAELVDSAVPVASVIDVDFASIPSEDPNDPRQAVGVTAPVDVRIGLESIDVDELSSQPLPAGHGAVRANGTGFIWTAIVEADGAAALRLNLTDVFLPYNAYLFVYNDQGDVAGPYTLADNGELWTRTLVGDRLTLQVHYDGIDTARVLEQTRFTIFDAGVLDERFLLARYQQANALDRSFCSFNEPCIENASCSSIPGAVQTAKDAVALMVFRSGAWQYICSGGLIADSDSSTDIPYFLTANHCISKGGEASSLETYFDFTTSCGGGCDIPSTATVAGSSIVATNRTSDYTLLQLSSSPAGAVYLPTNNTPIAYADGTALYRLSHPAGAPQAYSEHVVDTSYGECRSWPRGAWIYSADTYGGTEGGSSGSPVLNAAGEVVGQLSGGCGTNVGDACDSVSNATVDGALAAYWDEVAPFLDPGSGGGCTPIAEICDDGIDNDCDGLIDADDTEDCGGGGGGGSCDLGAKGDSCSSAADCCSGKCKGKPGAATCK